MTGELLKKLFWAIASDDKEKIYAVQKLIIEDKKQKGQLVIAKDLEAITRKTNNLSTKFIGSIPKSLGSQTPLLSIISRDNLKHDMILPNNVEKRFQKIIKEYDLRHKLASYGLRNSQKILLYGLPGCGKTMGAERLAWETGLPLLKVNTENLFASYLGETAKNLRLVFESAAKQPCLLFFDEFDSIAISRSDSQELGEIKRLVNSFLQILEEYNPNNGLFVVATNLTQSLDKAIWRRFDDVIEVLPPEKEQLKLIVKQTLSKLEIKIDNWDLILEQMAGFSAAQAVKACQDAAKTVVLNLNQEENVVIQQYIEQAIHNIYTNNSHCKNELN